MSIAFLTTSPYQVYHYKWIAPHVADPTVVIEVREHDYGLSEEFIRRHLQHCEIDWVSSDKLSTLDGRFEAIVCQTPVLPLEFLDHSFVVAQQYSLAKEQYQYGAWRSHAHLNLMYGPYSVGKVQGFSHAVAVGNPLLDPHWHQGTPDRRPLRTREPSPGEARPGGTRPRILYLPTYGDLSSLRSVLPRLPDIDADITLKLHHGDDAEVVAGLPDHIRIAYPDADPVALLRTHDGVISDFSGAAFDALHLGVPVVLAGVADPSSRDFTRLSADDLDHSLLRDVAALWRPDNDLLEAFAAAQRRLGSDAYHDFRARTLVNPGSAGAACAEEIRRLITDGEPRHFGAQQVRTATRRYISSARELRSRLPDESRDGGRADRRARAPERRAGGTGGGRVGVRGYRRLRRLLARSQRLRRAVHAVRRWRQRPPGAIPQDSAGPPPAPTPAGRREEVLLALLPRLAGEGVTAALDTEQQGADVAVVSTAKRGLHRALTGLGAERTDLRVRVGVGSAIVDSRPLRELSFFDLFNADWLEIGAAREIGSYRIGSAGFLTMLFVDHDRNKQRYLASKRRAGRADWTPVFATAGAGTPHPAVSAVGAKRPHASAPVDVVYTWVDSSDPAWRAAHQRYSEGQDLFIPSAANSERYLDREELRYSLRSLWMFAPFVRNIYIVTADQHPPWLMPDHPRVKTVSHREIFPQLAALPTFNSHAIEACLHRVPGLSESFLYLNDDVFLGQEASEEDFFTIAGLAKVRFSPSQYIYQGRPAPSAIPTDWAAYNAVSLIEKDFGQVFDRRVMHVPMPLRKSLLWELEEKYQVEIERTRAARFRSTTDVAVPSMFAHYYAIATARAVEWPTVRYDYIYLDTGRADSLDRFDEILRHTPRFFCLNATRHTQLDLSVQARKLDEFLSSAFPVPAPWETDEPVPHHG